MRYKHQLAEIKKLCKQLLLRYGFSILFILFVSNIGLLYAIRLLTLSKTCFTRAQVPADSRCLYILNNHVYEKGSRTKPHKGHSCGMDVTSIIPSFHLSNIAKYLDPNYVGDICTVMIPTHTPTPSATATRMPTLTPFRTLTPSYTPVVTPTRTLTQIPSPTRMPTHTPSPTRMPTHIQITFTPTVPPSRTPTVTPFPTKTVTPILQQQSNTTSISIPTATNIPLPSPTGRPTITIRPTPSKTPSPAPSRPASIGSVAIYTSTPSPTLRHVTSTRAPTAFQNQIIRLSSTPTPLVASDQTASSAQCLVPGQVKNIKIHCPFCGRTQ